MNITVSARGRLALTMAVIVTATALSGCSSSRDLAANTASTAAANGSSGPGAADGHWHVAFGVWLCDRYVGELIDRHGDQDGIHTHEDGLIHIHPSREETAGPNAVLARFLAEVDLELNDERLVLPDGTARSNGDQCSSGPGRLAVYQWAPSPAGDATAEVVTTDLDQVLLRDNHALALVFAPEDADIPPPPSVYALDTVGDIEPPAPNQPVWLAIRGGREVLSAGERIQVKLGPFSRSEADKMHARLEKVGLPGSMVRPDGK